ncbi:hypothetical protein B0H12DRAFT_1326923 [Mycena haematopus]|nr:hypothetical protein B0H12DRAFT_1326923 [Mycena haematopus]
MSRSPFELPTRVPVACKHCRERKVKCIHDSRQTSCMRCQLNGLSCEYVATKKQQERSRNACPRPSRRRSTKKASSPPTISQAELPSTTQGSPTSSSPDGDSLEGYSPSGSFYMGPFSAATPMPMNSDSFTHIYPADYWPTDCPPLSYDLPIHNAHQEATFWDVPRSGSDMYSTTTPQPIMYPIDAAYYGWEDPSQMSQCYCACNAGDPCF